MLNVVFQFDDLDDFDGKPTKVMEEVTATVIKAQLESLHPDMFNVAAFITSKTKPPTRRNLVEGQSSGSVRGLQESAGLQVTLEIYVDTRSANTYNVETMKGDVGKSFDSQKKRDDFIESLQNRDISFSRINAMDVSVNDEAVILIKDGPSAWIYIGCGIAAGVLAIGLFSFIGYRRRTRDNNSFNDVDFVDPPGSQGPRGQFIETIETEDQDVSTLGDPVFGGPSGMFAAHFGQEDPNESTLSSGYDYKMAYGGAGDMPSVSSAGGTASKSIAGTRALADDLTADDDPRRRIDSVDSSRVSAVHEDLSMFEEDNSFDRMYGQDERIDVVAPPGKLGVVIDTPMNGAPMVHAIKETSVLVDRVRIGDKLVSVDGEDTTEMSAIRVSKLISAKAMNAQRRMVFMRSASPS